jgi:hypothetical protein
MAGKDDLETILSTKKSKSEPSADMKLIIKLHNQWCQDNGYPIRKMVKKRLKCVKKEAIDAI